MSSVFWENSFAFLVDFDGEDWARLGCGENLFKFVPLAVFYDGDVVFIEVKGRRGVDDAGGSRDAHRSYDSYLNIPLFNNLRICGHKYCCGTPSLPAGRQAVASPPN